MRAAKFLDEKSNLTSQNRLLQFAVVALVLAEAVQGVATVRALRYQRTILLPASLNHQVEFVGDRASPEYVREFARYAVGLALNVTPATASGNFEELLTLYSPRAYGTGRKTFYAMARDIEGAKVSGVFYPLKIRPEEARGRIEIEGHRKLYTDDLLVESARRTYVLRYELVDGRFQILGLVEKAEEAELEAAIQQPAPGEKEETTE
ncbi:MAG: type IV conjugative transfer system protein TraE [Thermodesulfobacteriota bacterium]